MYYGIGYVSNVEKKPMKNGKNMTKFKLSIPMGKKDDGSSRYYSNFWTSFEDLDLIEDDKIEMTGDVYDRKGADGKYVTDKICSMAKVLYRKGNNEDNNDNIPF